MISLMKHALINDFQILIDNNYSYSKIQPYLNINGIMEVMIFMMVRQVRH